MNRYMNDEKDSSDGYSSSKSCNSDCINHHPHCDNHKCKCCKPTDLTGPTGSSAIIPFASGLPITVTTVLGGLVGLPAFVGFGSSAPGLSVLGATIDLTNPAGTLSNFAFSVPRAGTITDMTAFFITTAAVSLLGSTVTITAQLYASIGTNIFSPIASAIINLAPPLTGILAIGTYCFRPLCSCYCRRTFITRLLRKCHWIISC